MLKNLNLFFKLYAPVELIEQALALVAIVKADFLPADAIAI